VKRLLVIFLLLQVADFTTTIAVIAMGGAEQNPLVMHLMGMGTYTGLLVAKLIVFGMGVAIAMAGRLTALRTASYIFGGIVLWNLSVIGRLMLGAS
jgi:hypothetical protein